MELYTFIYIFFYVFVKYISINMEWLLWPRCQQNVKWD